MRIHPTALVSPKARLGLDVVVGPFAVVEDDVAIGDRTVLHPHVVVRRFTTLGCDNEVHEGAVLGGEPQDVSFKGADSFLRVGDANRIREGVTIHRSAKADGTTLVGSRCFLMACSHVAHDDVLGDDVILANNVALAGHVTIGDRAFLSGGVVVHQFCRIGRLAMVGGNSKIIKDCLPFVTTDGVPARARGLNVVGLRRAGFSASALRALKEAYRVLLRAGLSLATALNALDKIDDPNAHELAAFVRDSRRGFHRSAVDGAGSEEV